MRLNKFFRSYSCNRNSTLAKIQFIKGLDENALPDIRFTSSRGSSIGTCTFRFRKPNISNKHTLKKGEITGMYLIDEEGILET